MGYGRREIGTIMSDQQPDSGLPPGFSGTPVNVQPPQTPAPAPVPAQQQASALPPGFSGTPIDVQPPQSTAGAAIQGGKEALVNDPFVQGTIGAAKGAAETLLGGADMMDKALTMPTTLLRLIPGVKQQLDKWSPEMGKPSDYVKAATGDPNATLEAHGLAQNVGKIGESLAEFMVGGEALKGLTWPEKVGELSKAAKVLQQYPRLASILSNGLRLGAVGGLQDLVKTGAEDPEKSLKIGAETGAGGAAIEGAAAIAKPLAEKAFSYLNTKGAIRALNVDELKNGFFPNAHLGGTELSAAVQKDLDAVQKQLYDNYGSKLADFSPAAKEAGITVGAAGSPLATKAAELLQGSSGDYPESLEKALKVAKTPGTERVEPLLEEFAQGKTLNWDQAVNLRKDLANKAYHSANDDPAKQILNQLRNALDDNLETSAAAADAPELEENLKALRADYHETITSLNKNAVVKGLKDKDYDTVAATLMRNNTIASNVETVRGLLNRIGSKNMESVEASIFDKISGASTVTNGTDSVVDAKKFITKFRNIPPDVRQAIWGDKAKEINDALATGANESLIPRAEEPEIVKRLSGHLFGGVAGPVGIALTGAAWAAWRGDYKTAIAALGSAAVIGASKNPKVQKAILSTMQSMIDGNLKTGIVGTGNAVSMKLQDTPENKAKAFGTPEGNPTIQSPPETKESVTPKETYSVPQGWTKTGPTDASGMITPGNIDLTTRPIVKNADGSHSSEYSTSIEDENGHEVLLPTVVDGKFLTPDGKKPPAGHHEKQPDGSDRYIPSPEEKIMFRKAWQHYEKTGQHLGIFNSWRDADKAAEQIHSRPLINQAP